ncbi:hypothetical protein [Gramella sp. AN32]|uniref:CRISPR-associated protein Csh1 n=1 Tax=Christiangramia antarctica TaxID=2058158 RepID=A0ABW5X7F9_9FLAO|nr:hypothetical protein [Gramella sp. AN32]MCM4154761.1 hypothetical protein [Gramella sp. AN32]
MLTELINFTGTLSEDFKSLGLNPKEGLHILLQVKDDGSITTKSETIRHAFYSKKLKGEQDAILEKCKKLQENAWCVNTNKCFDLPMKAIHTCSPICMAFKREHLKGGAKFDANIAKGKPQLQERFESYFEKAEDLLTENELLIKAFESFKAIFEKESWKVILEDTQKQRAGQHEVLFQKKEKIEDKIKDTLDKSEKELLKESLQEVQSQLLTVQPLADSDYILFYLDFPLAVYKETHGKYLDDKLFNTDKYNTKPDAEGIIYGTNDFQNGYNANMPFLLHQTATFDITGRISNLDARTLYEFGNILPRKTLPNPLPIFVYENEFKKRVIALYKVGRLGFRDLVDSLYQSHKEDFKNYYLLNWSNTQNGIVFNDFDFVARFEYSLGDVGGLKIENYFNLYESGKEKHYKSVKNIFQLEDRVLKYLIQNKYHRVDYFSDFKKEDYENRDFTFLSFCKYRKAIYDYVYKSNRNTIHGEHFDEMVFNGIKDDFKNNSEYGIKEKLNLWYSLHDYFHEPNNLKPKNMASKLKEYRDFVVNVATGKEYNLDDVTDKHFAFAAGQVIGYLLDKSASENKNYQLLEPYLQKSKCDELQKAIANDVIRYKHAIENNELRFKNVFAFVETWETNKNIKDLLPELISGVFSKSIKYISTKND